MVMKTIEDELHRRGLLDWKHGGISGGGNDDGFYTTILNIERYKVKDSEFMTHKLGKILGSIQ